jgi:hypothetical protein
MVVVAAGREKLVKLFCDLAAGGEDEFDKVPIALDPARFVIAAAAAGVGAPTAEIVAVMVLEKVLGSPTPAWKLLQE